MGFPIEPTFIKQREIIKWKRKFEYTANVKKLRNWMKKRGYNKKNIIKLSDMGEERGEFVYSHGNFTLYEAKKLAVLVGMSLYDFIDIFLSDIYPVTQEDFDILSNEDINAK